jgi:uncharacterized protein (TIGR02598 family)
VQLQLGNTPASIDLMRMNALRNESGRRAPEASRGRAPRSSLAFSLVEVMVSVIVVATVFFALYAGISFGFATLGLSREELRATQVLAEKMETIRLYNWEQINSNGFIPTTFTAPFDATTNGDSGITYTGRVTIATAPISEAYSNDVRKITVEVQWRSAKVMRTRTMSTFSSRYGLQNYIY